MEINSQGRSQIKVWIGIGSLVGGGAEKQVELLVNQLDPRLFDVRVGYVKEKVGGPVYPEHVTRRFLTRSSKWRWDQIWRQVRDEFRNWQPDVVHVWLPEVISLPGAVCARCAGIPCITSVRRSNFKGIGWRNWGREMLNVMPHFFSDHVVANFSLERELVPLRVFWRWRSAEVIPNGVRPSVRGYGDLVRGLPAEKRLSFVFVGRFAEQKRLPFLIETLARMNGAAWELTVFGRGSEPNEIALSNRVAQLGLKERIRFAGFVPDWRKEARGFDYLVFPSVSEGMPNVVVEAMAEGLPVIASRIPELSNILLDEINGFFFRPDDPESLIQAINRANNQRDQYAEYSRAAVETAERFSLQAMGVAYEELYNRFAKGGI